MYNLRKTLQSKAANCCTRKSLTYLWMTFGTCRLHREQGSRLRFFHVVHWTSKFRICKLLKVRLKILRLMWILVPERTKYLVFRFSSLKLRRLDGCRNVAVVKLKHPGRKNRNYDAETCISQNPDREMFANAYLSQLCQYLCKQCTLLRQQTSAAILW